MRTTMKVAAVSIAAFLTLAGCGSLNNTGSVSSTGTGSTLPGLSLPTTPGAGNPATGSSKTATPAAGMLGPAERADLDRVHEQERVGLDALTVFAARYASQPVFANLANSQKTQLAAVTAMTGRYGLGDPSGGLTAGRYADGAIQQLYDSTVAAGTSSELALDAVERFEQVNLASLQTARGHTTRADLVTMYTNLEQASNAHTSACNDAGQSGSHDTDTHNTDTDNTNSVQSDGQH